VNLFVKGQLQLAGWRQRLLLLLLLLLLRHRDRLPCLLRNAAVASLRFAAF
jgi:hypothetical protein